MRIDRPPAALQRLVQRAAATRPVAWLAARVLHRIDHLVFRVSRGRTTFSTGVSGLPVVMLTTTGARTGQRRTVPVLAIPDGDRLVVIASNFGQQNHPAWYYNLRAHPRAQVSIDGVNQDYAACEVTGAERDRYFQRGIEINPGWSSYEARARARRIPVLRLDPVAA
jgi:deazaflavin-dependent oxidoreductase (nitroreductase family)